jgi:branched-chain amino acid aminotransferase
MINIVSDKNVMNNQIISKEETNILLYEESPKIYEVIRVIEGRTIFLKEHFDRMNESIRLSGAMGGLNYEEFKSSIELLIKENSLKNCNIRVSYYYKDNPVTLFYFIKSYYPSKEEFNEGIHTVTVKMERANPNIKSYQKELKDNVARIMEENNAFEAILINHDDTVSEGSKSNVFFVKGNKLITSPDSAVLLGVTRSKVISVCMGNSIEVEKRIIKFDEIKNFDGAFITGTSNDVLPIRTIDDMFFNSSENEVVKRVSELYLGEVRKEIER